MTEDPERELTPEEDARIRSLLASARTSEKVPDDVAARLDVVLADLASGRSDDAVHGSRPRWRRGRVLLAAAAAVGVVGLAGVALPQLGGVNGGQSDSTATQSEAGGSSGSAAAPRDDSAGGKTRLTAAAELSTDSFRGDVRRLLSGDSAYRLSPRALASPKSSADPTPTPTDQIAGGACLATPGAGVVRSSEVLLDGKPALLEVFGVKDGARVVRAVSCDGTETLASTRIPAR